MLAAVGGALTVAYSARVLREVWSGDRLEPRIPDAVRTERYALRLLGALVLVLGVLPVLLLTVTAPVTAAVIGR